MNFDQQNATDKIPAPKVLVTGGAGFFGGVLIRHLLAAGCSCVSLDLHATEMDHGRLLAVRGDICDASLVDALFEKHRFSTVFHCAAVLAHATDQGRGVVETNTGGTRNIVDAAARFGTRSVVFTSTNCLWASNMGRPVREDDPPTPAEIYGKSKLEAEKILLSYRNRLNVISIRCPTIVDEGRLGLLAILFEFIMDGRKVWTVGGGYNRYQFIYGPDLAEACLCAAAYEGSIVFNIGSDDVPTLRETYQYIIDRANTGAKIGTLPRVPALAALRAAHLLKISPLGPYHYRMIGEDFEFDTTLIKDALAWRPTLNNNEMLWRAYCYFEKHRKEIAQRTSVSAHRQATRMGVIRLLKWVS